MKFLLRSTLRRGGEILSGSTLPHRFSCHTADHLKEAMENRDTWRLNRVLDTIPNSKFLEMQLDVAPWFSNVWREEDDCFNFKTPLEAALYYGNNSAVESVLLKMLKCKPTSEVVSEASQLLEQHDIPETFLETVLTRRNLRQCNTLTQDW